MLVAYPVCSTGRDSREIITKPRLESIANNRNLIQGQTFCPSFEIFPRLSILAANETFPGRFSERLTGEIETDRSFRFPRFSRKVFNSTTSRGNSPGDKLKTGFRLIVGESKSLIHSNERKRRSLHLWHESVCSSKSNANFSRSRVELDAWSSADFIHLKLSLTLPLNFPAKGERERERESTGLIYRPELRILG